MANKMRWKVQEESCDQWIVCTGEELLRWLEAEYEIEPPKRFIVEAIAIPNDNAFNLPDYAGS